MKGFALTTVPGLQILSTYSAPQDDIESVAATPGWEVVGAFYLPIAAALRIELVGMLSAAGLTMRARVFDVTAAAPITTSYASISATTEARAVSGVLQLAGAHIYQLQVEVTGATGQFGVVRSVAPTVE